MNKDLLEICEEHLEIRLASAAAMRVLLDAGKPDSPVQLADALHELDDMLDNFYARDVLHQWALAMYELMRTDDDMMDRVFGITEGFVSIAEAIIADDDEELL